MSAHSVAHLGVGTLSSLSVSAATSPGLVQGTEDMPPSTCSISLNLRKRNFYIFYFHPCQFLENFLMSNSSSMLEVRHAVGFIYWSLYLLIPQTLIDHYNVPGTKSVAVDPCSLLRALLELKVWWEKRTTVRRAFTWSGVELFSRNCCYFRNA